nr:immunoglobulin light chain junction region [Macaca mulatta]
DYHCQSSDISLSVLF